MLLNVVRLLATATVTLLLVTLLVFCLIHLAPGEPLGEEPGDAGLMRLGEQARAELRAQYHLDQPLPKQYLLWFSDLLRGDLGRSFHDRRPVRQKIAERLGLTLTLNACSLAVLLLVAVPLGTVAALSPGSAWDRFAAGGGRGYLVDFSRRPLGLRRGGDRTGRNDFSIGHDRGGRAEAV